MNFLERLVPRFLQRIDQYLLVNYPMIWRTKVHYITFYSFILGNILLFGLAKLAVYSGPLNRYFVEHFQFGFFILLGFVLLFWAYTQYKFLIKNRQIKHIAASLLVYVFALTSFFTNHTLFIHTLASTTASLYEVNQFNEDSSFFEDNQYLRIMKPEESATFNRASNPEWREKANALLRFYRLPTLPKGELYSYQQGNTLYLHMQFISRSHDYMNPSYTGYKYSNYFSLSIEVGAIILFFSVIFFPPALLLVSLVPFLLIIKSIFVVWMMGIGALTLMSDEPEVLLMLFICVYILLSVMTSMSVKRSIGQSLFGTILVVLAPCISILLMMEYIRQIDDNMFLSTIVAGLISGLISLFSIYQLNKIQAKPQG